MDKISIIIPAYNEEKRITSTLNNYLSYFAKEYANNFEIIVILNGCLDQTREIVENLQRNCLQIRCFSYQRRMGKGGALIEGFKKAAGDILTYIDADGAIKPDELDRLINALKDCDGVIGSKYLNGSEVKIKQPLMRIIASRGFHFLVQRLFGMSYKDTQCGSKVFRNYLVKDILDGLTEKGWVFDVDLLWHAARKGYRIKEVPITWEHKEGSKFGLYKAVLPMFFATLRLRLKNIP